MLDKFFYLVRLGLGLDIANGDIRITSDEWRSIIDLANKQAMLGILTAGIEHIPDKSGLSDKDTMQLIMAAIQIRKGNTHLNHMCGVVTKALTEAGFDSCILKGQGVSKYYPDPGLRQSGDIDVWIKPHDVTTDYDIDARLPETISRIKALNKGKVTDPIYYHLEWLWPDINVELHYRVSYFNNPSTNQKLHRWSARHWADIQTVDGFNMPSAAFNAVYLMLHIYRHLLLEGVGMRQIADYAMLLHSYKFSDREKHEIMDAIRGLKMTRFASALMWVVKYAFHIPESELLFVPDEREGRFFLDEIIRAGNFGRYDDRINRKLHRTTLGRFWVRTKHRIKFTTKYPSEIIWDIPYRLWHWQWRRSLSRKYRLVNCKELI